MDYLTIPDDFSRTGLKKSLRKIKNDLWNSPNLKRRLTIMALSLFAFWSIVLPMFKYMFLSSPTVISSSLFTSRPYNMKTSYDSLIYEYNKLPSDAPLRSKLAFYFPYDQHSEIPNTIFQTWKVSNTDSKFPMDFINPYKSWTQKNENFTHSIITDNMLDEWVKQEFSNVPEIVRAWSLLPKIILKADFFRYLIIFARGGIYSDMDTSCLKPVENWAIFDESYLGGLDKSSIGFGIGIEADPDRPDWAEWYARRIQFVQWTIIGKRGHPFLRELISRIVEETFRKEKSSLLKSIEGKDEGGDIMSWTGPGIYTDTMFDYLNNIMTDGEYGSGFGIGSEYWNNGEKYKLKHQEVNEDGLPLHFDDMVLNYKNFTGLTEPVVYDDIMVLPITSFSPGVGQMGSKSPRHPLAFVLHNFKGTWKPEA